GIQAPATSGISINAGQGDIVSLRGLVIDGLVGGGGNTGVVILHAMVSALHVQNCVIRNFTVAGIGMANVGHSKLLVSDTLIHDNGSGSATGLAGGIFLSPPQAGSTDVVLNRVRLEGNDRGLIVIGDNAGTGGSGPSNVSVRNSVFSANAFDGLL